MLTTRQMTSLQPLHVFRPAEIMTKWLLHNAAGISAAFTSLQKHPKRLLGFLCILLIVVCAITVTR